MVRSHMVGDFSFTCNNATYLRHGCKLKTILGHRTYASIKEQEAQAASTVTSFGAGPIAFIAHQSIMMLHPVFYLWPQIND